MKQKTWASPIVDPLESPRYSAPEAARYLGMPKSTLASWIRGRDSPTADGVGRFSLLIRRPDDEDPRLSFANLIEAHALRAIRTKYKVPLKDVRSAIDYVQSEYEIDRLLLSPELRAAPGQLVLERLGDLINIGQRGQLAMKEILQQFLDRIEFTGSLPSAFFPFTRRDQLVGPKKILIDPRIASGRPVTKHRAIRTATITDRFLAGESVVDISTDYRLEVSEVEEAIRYERSKAA